jgi:Protein of unknown function (DUF3072)
MFALIGASSRRPRRAGASNGSSTRTLMGSGACMSDYDLPATSAPTDAAAKDPDEWVTGDEPMTGAQASYLATLARDTDREIPEHLSKAAASKLIDELRAQSPRARDRAPGRVQEEEEPGEDGI